MRSQVEPSQGIACTMYPWKWNLLIWSFDGNGIVICTFWTRKRHGSKQWSMIVTYFDTFQYWQTLPNLWLFSVGFPSAIVKWRKGIHGWGRRWVHGCAPRRTTSASLLDFAVFSNHFRFCFHDNLSGLQSAWCGVHKQVNNAQQEALCCCSLFSWVN